MTTALERYLRKMQEIRASGAATSETSYYPALGEMLTELGGKLKPKVIHISNPADAGAGRPDFSLTPPTN